MPGFTVRLDLVSKIEVLPDGIHVTKQTEITRTSHGLQAPAAMEPFVHLITLHAVVSDIQVTASHLVHFQIEHPDGTNHSLVQARMSDWPEWALEHGTAEAVHEAEDREVPLRPRDEIFVAGDRWLAIRPLALRVVLAGDHTIRVIVDRNVVAGKTFRVIYERAPYDDPPI